MTGKAYLALMLCGAFGSFLGTWAFDTLSPARTPERSEWRAIEHQNYTFGYFTATGIGLIAWKAVAKVEGDEGTTRS